MRHLWVTREFLQRCHSAYKDVTGVNTIRYGTRMQLEGVSAALALNFVCGAFLSKGVESRPVTAGNLFEPHVSSSKGVVNTVRVAAVWCADVQQGATIGSTISAVQCNSQYTVCDATGGRDN